MRMLLYVYLVLFGDNRSYAFLMRGFGCAFFYLKEVAFMKQFKKSVLSFVLALCLLTAFPLASDLSTKIPLNIGVIEVQATSKVKLNKTKIVLIKGQTYTLKVQNTKKKVKWSSSKKSIATVNSQGKVTAKKKGTATISAKVGSKTYKCKVTVETPSISKTKASITIFSSSTLSVKGTSQKITWKSSNTKIATVDSKGKVKAKKLGSATITASVGEKKKKYTCKVTVVDTKKGKAYEALKKVIDQYGYFDKDGDKRLEYTDDYSSSADNYTSVYILNDTLLLVLNTYYSDGAYSYTHVALDKYSNTATVYYEYYYSVDNAEPDDIAIVSFNSKTWNNHTLYFDIEQTALDGEYDYLVQNLANANLKDLVSYAEYLLDMYGFSLNNLGFDSYVW